MSDLLELLNNLTVSAPILGVLIIAVLAFLGFRRKKPESRREPPPARPVPLDTPDEHGIVQPTIYDHTGDSGLFDDDSTVHVTLPDGSTEVTPAPVGVDDDDIEDIVAIQPEVTNVTRLPDDETRKPATTTIPLDEMLDMMRDQERMDEHAKKPD